MAVLSALVLFGARPALTGTWVYDDWTMEQNPLMEGARQALAVFTHNSDSYMSVTTGTPGLPTNPTYRPLPMLSFIAVTTLVGKRPLAHHALSVAFHLATLLLLVRFASRRGRLSLSAAWLLGAFALHPALGEAWLWINGRSDAMAGVALAAAGLVLLRPREGRRPLVDGLILLPIFLAGILCKETFLIAAAALVVASILTDEPQRVSLRERATELLRSGRRSLPTIGAFVCATATYFAARHATLRTTGPALGGLTEFRLLPFLDRAPRLLALAMETLLVPVPRSMRLLAWELDQPWTAAHLMLLVALVGALVLLGLRGKLRAAVLVLGAAATLLPVYLVSESETLWLGFDRYLYLPLVLLVLAALPTLVASPRLGRFAQRRGSLAALGASLLLLTAASRGVAQCYRSNDHWILSMIELRPEEPTGYVLAAGAALDQGQPALAATMLDRLPTTDVPPPMVNALTAALVKLGRGAEAVAVQERACAHHPGSVDLQYQLFFLRGAQRRWSEALSLAEGLSRDPVRGEVVRARLREWLAAGALPSELRARFEALAR